MSNPFEIDNRELGSEERPAPFHSFLHILKSSEGRSAVADGYLGDLKEQVTAQLAHAFGQTAGIQYAFSGKPDVAMQNAYETV